MRKGEAKWPGVRDGEGRDGYAEGIVREMGERK